MNVRRLIDLLRDYPADAEVKIYNPDAGDDVPATGACYNSATQEVILQSDEGDLSI